MAALKGVRVHGTIRPPGDKSISHRALILSALASGRSRVGRILRSADIESTASALRQIGMPIPPLADDLVIDGMGGRLRSPGETLDCGNSGTTTRLLAGVVAGGGDGVEASFTGDASLRRRPMRRVAEPLRAMGADVELSEAGGLPMRVRGGPLRPLDWTSPVSSAQVKSAILLAATLAGVRVRVTEPALSRDHTERMLSARGVTLHRDGATVTLEPGQRIGAADMLVPADPSSAAFFVALAALAAEGELRVADVCLNETRTGFLRVLRRMGADISIEDERADAGERVGAIRVASSRLRGTVVAPVEIPSLIDELPILACVAARAEGETVVSGAGELRVKESDRISTMVDNLRGVGVDAEEREDGFVVRGADRPLSGHVQTEGDHRVAMSFGVLGAASGGGIVIDEPGCASVSYPAFWRDLQDVTR